MSSIVRLGPGKSGGPLGITSEGKGHTILTPTMRAIRFAAGDVMKVGGAGDGDAILDKIVDAGKAVLVHTPTSLHPRKYEILVSYNPELLRHGIVSVPATLEPGTRDLFLQFRALKKTDLSQFDYIFEFRLLD